MKITNDIKNIESYLIESLDEPLRHENIVEIRKILGPFLKTSLDFAVVYNNNKVPIFTSGNPPDKSIVDSMLLNKTSDNPFSVRAEIKYNNEIVGFFAGSLRETEILSEKTSLLFKIIQAFLLLLIFNTFIIYFTLNSLARRIISLSKFITEYPTATNIDLEPVREMKINDEVSRIYTIFQEVYNRNIFLMNSLNEKTLLELIGNQAKQVAHDIRSPLSALNMVTSSLQGLESEQKELIKSSIQRINDIANDLLKKGKSSPVENSDPSANINEVETVLINPLVDSIITEKRLQFNNKTNLNIAASTNQVYGSFIHINSSDLKRVLSNLINNSVEAIDKKSGTIEVFLDSNTQFALIKIKDNGPGIPPHILDKLGIESVTYGKDSTDSGSGLGVLHAKKTIESMQGQFSITSKLGVGTEVTISLPLAEKPIWFLDTLKLKEKSAVLICDDDSSIIALWKKRLSDFSSISPYYFTDLDSLSSFLKDNPDLNFTLLIDFEFSGEQKTGLDFIIENQLASKAVLVTSHYEEDRIIQSCLEHGIKQIPKNICALVPIEMANSKEYYDAVVLDDEDLQIRSWQFAAIQKGKKILTFSKSDEFLSALSNIDHQSCLFIDSILSESTKGEDIATKVNAMGFTNIYMSSGHDPSYFNDMKFLKGIIGKTPYFP